MLSECLVCDSHKLDVFVSIGSQCLANSFHRENEDSLSLDVARCRDCGHHQLAQTFDANVMYEIYPYVSGTSETLKRSFDNLAIKLTSGAKLRSRSNKCRVLDIACNDGSLMESFLKLDCEVVGVDPAKNLSDITRAKGLNVICDYWVSPQTEQIGTFDVITALNVLGHTLNPQEFLKRCARSMSKDGRLYIQTSQVDWIRKKQFDCIYHEHVSYFSPDSMRRLAERMGFEVESMHTVDDHGGSLAVILKNPLQDFRLSIKSFVDMASQTLDHLRSNGWLICGYGAAAKGSVVLQTGRWESGPEFVVDENPLKIGGWMPGTKIPIKPPEAIAGIPKLAVILFAWNFADEIKRKVLAMREGLETTFVILPDKID